MSEPQPPVKKPRRRLSARKRLLFALLTLGVLFGVPEAFCQVREVVRASRKPRLPVEDCPYRITRLTPGARVVREGQTISINSLGLRGPEVTPEKPPGALRVACVGASTTFGLYAKDDASTWPAMLERRLRAAGGAGRAVEVLNCGAPGWTSRASLTNLEMVVFGLKPDVVVVYHNHNDLLENRQLRYQQDSRVEDWHDLYRHQPVDLLNHSALFRLISGQFRAPYSQLIEKAPALDPEGTAAFERNLRRLVRRCQEQGAKVLLCTYPRSYRDTLAESEAAKVPELERWYGSTCPLEYPAFMEGLRLYDTIVQKVGADAKVPVVDLVNLVPNDVALYVSPIHHSEAGEEKVSGFVADALLEHRLLEPGHP